MTKWNPAISHHLVKICLFGYLIKLDRNLDFLIRQLGVSLPPIPVIPDTFILNRFILRFIAIIILFLKYRRNLANLSPV